MPILLTRSVVAHATEKTPSAAGPSNRATRNVKTPRKFEASIAMKFVQAPRFNSGPGSMPWTTPPGGAIGRNSVSVAVVDRAGRLRVFLQGDNANPHNSELARRKAYTARTFRQPSAEWAKRTETANAGQRMLAEVIPLGGGMPINAGEDTIGGVGLSGAIGGQPKEEACAKAGIAKVADQLR